VILNALRAGRFSYRGQTSTGSPDHDLPAMDLPRRPSGHTLRAHDSWRARWRPALQRDSHGCFGILPVRRMAEVFRKLYRSRGVRGKPPAAASHVGSAGARLRDQGPANAARRRRRGGSLEHSVTLSLRNHSETRGERPRDPWPASRRAVRADESLA